MKGLMPSKRLNQLLNGMYLISEIYLYQESKFKKKLCLNWDYITDID